ncbi:hypothetical protein AVL63_02850 [Nesterenkonia jeotgali]|uniref:Uncharacterized protein n=1 Tax=Nesterenkonia jeotgali TaxID=317018 RepID=A0A0W8IG64_9MICC|nr:hypothetical protein AVL63_02850 [Nesterenkonia jeotgali]
MALVRLRISDVHNDPTKRLLTDDQLELFLAEHDMNIYRASADALRTIAASEVLTSKKIRTQDLSTDGPAVADALRALAADYDEKAADAELAAEGSFHLVPFGGAGGRLEAEERRVY